MHQVLGFFLGKHKWDEKAEFSCINNTVRPITELPNKMEMAVFPLCLLQRHIKPGTGNVTVAATALTKTVPMKNIP